MQGGLPRKGVELGCGIIKVLIWSFAAGLKHHACMQKRVCKALHCKNTETCYRNTCVACHMCSKLLYVCQISTLVSTCVLF